MTDNKRFTTVELPKPNKWGIWYDGAYLSTYQVCILLNEYVDVKKENEQLKSENKKLRIYKSDELETLNDLQRCYENAKKSMERIDALEKENEQLKQSIKEIDDAELHLKQIILKRIDDYIWEWEDEGTPVAQVLRELRDEIKGDVE